MKKPWGSQQMVRTGGSDLSTRSGSELGLCSPETLHQGSRLALSLLSTCRSSHVKAEAVRESDISAARCISKSCVKEDVCRSSLHCASNEHHENPEESISQISEVGKHRKGRNYPKQTTEQPKPFILQCTLHYTKWILKP